MIKFVKLTLAHNEQPIYVNVASIESFRAHVTDDKEDGAYLSTTSMRGDDAPIIVKETCERIYTCYTGRKSVMMERANKQYVAYMMSLTRGM